MSRALLRRLAFLALLAGCVCPALAMGPEEAALRSAMAYKLLLFVEWPEAFPAAERTLGLCVVGSDPELGRAFTALAGRSVRGLPLEIHLLGPLSDLGGCRAVYFDRLAPGLMQDKLRALAGHQTLVFSGDAPTASGTMVNILLDNRHLSFDVDLAALAREGLRLPARVLELAREVRR